MIKEIIETKESGNAIISIAIGGIYEKKWHKFVSENWKEYCDKNKLGLFLVTDNLISKQNPYWKKATWQKLILGVSIVTTNEDLEALESFQKILFIF